MDGLGALRLASGVAVIHPSSHARLLTQPKPSPAAGNRRELLFVEPKESPKRAPSLPSTGLTSRPGHSRSPPAVKTPGIQPDASLSGLTPVPKVVAVRRPGVSTVTPSGRIVKSAPHRSPKTLPRLKRTSNPPDVVSRLGVEFRGRLAHPKAARNCGPGHLESPRVVRDGQPAASRVLTC